jgi:hypothetical protein
VTGEPGYTPDWMEARAWLRDGRRLELGNVVLGPGYSTVDEAGVITAADGHVIGIMAHRPKLSMRHFLAVVAEHGFGAREVLIAQGFHPNVVYRKAEKAERKRYTDSGVVVDRPWLTDAGRAYLASDRP